MVLSRLVPSRPPSLPLQDYAPTDASTAGSGDVPAGWGSRDTARASGLLAVIVAIHVLAWGLLVGVVAPRGYAVGSQVLGLGIGFTAYTLGVRHAFDADHIAAIDNTTRKLVADGRRPLSVGFWFALGHSTLVVLLAGLVALGTRAAGALVASASPVHRALSAVGLSMSGLFLVLLGALNLAAFLAIARAARGMRNGRLDEQAVEDALQARGLLARALAPVMRSVTRPRQMYVVGLLFGLGFDTASEVTLLVLAATGAATGLPWWAVLVLPLLFAAGMSLFDTLDGTFMTVAYRWAFASPVRKVYYNLVVTGLSVTVALGIGGVELLTVLHDDLHLRDPASSAAAALPLGSAGYVVAALFVVVWGAAIAYWRFARVERRWEGPTG